MKSGSTESAIPKRFNPSAADAAKGRPGLMRMVLDLLGAGSADLATGLLPAF
jgi:hypothetical protein